VNRSGSWAGRFLRLEQVFRGHESAGNAVVPALCGTPVFDTGLHPVLGINSQSIGDAVDVIEVADDLSSHCDLLVSESCLAQHCYVRFVHLPRRQSQFDRVVAEHSVFEPKFCSAIVVDELLRNSVVSGLPTEVLCVRQSSVIAVVNVADDRSQHLALCGVKRIRRLHQANVEAE